MRVCGSFFGAKRKTRSGHSANIAFKAHEPQTPYLQSIISHIFKEEKGEKHDKQNKFL